MCYIEKAKIVCLKLLSLISERKCSVKKKTIIINKIVALAIGFVLVLALILMWWNGYTPLISRATIEKRLSQSLTTDYEYVSSEQKKGRRTEIHYIYRDANGIKFTVKSYKVQQGVYASDVNLWWSNRITCDYTQMFMAQYENNIKEIFGDRLESYTINTYNYEQLAETADMLAQMYVETPPYPINRELYEDLFNIDPKRLVVEFRYGDDYTYASSLGYFDFLCEGETVSNQNEILLSLENSMASLYKSGKIDIEIPDDVLMRKPPKSFESVMIGNTDINPKLARGVKWEENEMLLYPHYKGGRYQFSTYIFGGEHNSFAYIVKELGGSYELINSSHAKWEISGDNWEAHLESSKRVNVGIAQYDVDIINVTKNGKVLPPLESQHSGMYSLKDIEMLLGVRAEYTNDVAILYLIKE